MTKAIRRPTPRRETLERNAQIMQTMKNILAAALIMGLLSLAGLLETAFVDPSQAVVVFGW